MSDDEKVTITISTESADWLVRHVEKILADKQVNTQPEAHEIARELHAAGR